MSKIWIDHQFGEWIRAETGRVGGLNKSNSEENKKFWEREQNERESRNEGVQVVANILREGETLGADPIQPLEQGGQAPKNRGLVRDEDQGKGQEEGGKEDRMVIGGMEYTITILKEKNAGKHKVVEDIPEIADKMVQDDDQPLSGSLTNVQVALPDGSRLLKDLNHTGLLNRGKGVMEQISKAEKGGNGIAGRKIWRRGDGANSHLN